MEWRERERVGVKASKKAHGDKDVLGETGRQKQRHRETAGEWRESQSAKAIGTEEEGKEMRGSMSAEGMLCAMLCYVHRVYM